MKTKQGFILRNVCGENIIVAEGETNIDFSNIISMNETSAFLWNNIQGKEFTHDDLVDLLTEMRKKRLKMLPVLSKTGNRQAL